VSERETCANSPWAGVSTLFNVGVEAIAEKEKILKIKGEVADKTRDDIQRVICNIN
jgi:hypothetical protein